MSRTEEESNIAFQGQFYRGEAKSKSWSPVCSGQVTVNLQKKDEQGGVWQLVAFKGMDKMWEGCVDSSFKHRVRESFVQWQQCGEGGVPETYALRLKNSTAAQQFSEAISAALSAPVRKPKPAEGQETVKLRLLLPGKRTTSISVPKIITVSQLLMKACEYHQLDPAQHAIALPPATPHGQPVLCASTMTVGSLQSGEVHLVKRGATQPAAEGTSDGGEATEQTLLLHVELPKGERTVVRVSPLLSVKELLQYVCEKRNLDPATHFFDLPATEESLAGKTLEQLKINNIKVVLKESPTQKRKTSIKSKNRVNEKEKPADSPKTGRRVAPPPPPPQCRRTQPELMKELAAEMVDRKLYRQSDGGEGEVNGVQSGGGEEVKDEGAAQTDESQRRSSDPTAKTVTDDGSTLTRLKPRGKPAPPPPNKEGGPLSADPLPVSSRGSKPPPPPVAEKPRRNTGSKDQDEPDSGPPPSSQEPSSVSSAALDQIVLGGMLGGEGMAGVKGKVREHAERPEMSSAITEGLKKQAEGGGRYLSIKRKAPESPGTTQREQTKHNSLERPPKRPLDTNTLKVQRQGTEQRDVPSLKRRPRGPAPPPPKANTGKMKPREENATKTTKAVEEPKKSEGSESTPPMRLRPSRRAPSRPAPPSPQKRKVEKAAEAVTGEPPAAPQETQVVKQEDGGEPSQQELCETSDKAESVTSSAPSTPSTPSLNSSPSNTRRPDAATAIVDEKEDGRKVLIVKPSPHSQRKPSIPLALVFNLPPPPPLELDEQEDPAAGTEDVAEPPENRQEEDSTEQKLIEGSSSESKEEVGGSQKRVATKLSDEGIVVDDKPPSLSDELSEESRDVDESKVPMSPARSNLDETILSNEYTNLDDDCSSGEQTTDFSCEDNLDPIEDSARTEHDCAKEKPEDEDSELGGDGKEQSDTSTSSEGGYDIAGQERTGSSLGDSDSVCGYDVADASPPHKLGFSLPPPMPELAINGNANNSNSQEWTMVADIPPPSTFVPPPPEQMAVPEGEGGDGVVLISMVTHREDVPIIPEQMVEGGQEKSEGGERKGEELEDLPAEKKDSIGTQLNELDDMVSSLQKLITETTGTPPPSPPPPRPPPPRPPPPPSLPPVGSTEPLKSDTPPKQKSPIPAKPKPPPTKKKPVKPADPDAAQEELFAKLKERQLKLKAQTEAESVTSGPNSVPPPSLDPHARVPVTQPSGDMVQLQLQYLQQQVLQQQMMQLQQQFQQMQHMALQQQNVGVMMPSANQAFLQQTPVPNPSLLGLHHQPAVMSQPTIQHPAMVGPTTQPVPIAGFVPASGHPQLQALVQQPTGLYQQAQFPQGVAASHLVPPHATPAAYSTSLAPPSDPTPPPPPTTSPPTSSPDQMTLNPSGQNSFKQTRKRKPSHQDIRSTVLGEMEDQFDSLMEEVRDADPNEVLKKVPEEELERDPTSSSYTGMAAALAEALKQRRMHFTEKRRSKDLDESHCSEWGSP